MTFLLSRLIRPKRFGPIQETDAMACRDKAGCRPLGFDFLEPRSPLALVGSELPFHAPASDHQDGADAAAFGGRIVVESSFRAGSKPSLGNDDHEQQFTNIYTIGGSDADASAKMYGDDGNLCCRIVAMASGYMGTKR